MTETMQAIDPADYALPESASDAEVVALLRNPLVRLCNIYRIKDADGRVCQFTPNPPQCAVLHAVYIEKEQRIAIPKARAIGFSTLIALILFDRAHFVGTEGAVSAAIIDQTQPDAQAKLAKIEFAYDKLPTELKDVLTQRNKSTLEWANGSSITAGLNARGRTPQLLHISEWGPIAYHDPIRSQEIVTGALQAASGKSALVFAESTHKGGKGGDWYNLIKRSLETAPEHRTDKDFRVMFFPWWQEARYSTAGDVSQIDKDTRTYLDKKERETGYTFTPGQRLFYFKKKAELGRNIFAEFPTTIEECWQAPFTGAIYGPDVDKARADGRINENVSHYEGFPVYSAFDIGAPTNTKCWLFQTIGDRINMLQCLSGGDDCNTPGEWAKRLKEQPYSYGGHFLPHDGETLWRTLMIQAGLKGVVVMQKVVNEWDNINDALSAFSRCHFHAKHCEHGTDALEAFRSKEEADGVTIRNVPVHDWASHASTAFGYIHQAIRLGLLVDRSAMPAKPKHNGPGIEVKTGLRDNHARSIWNKGPRVVR